MEKTLAYEDWCFAKENVRPVSGYRNLQAISTALREQISGKRILDIGSGNGIYSLLFAAKEAEEVWAVEPETEEMEKGRTKARELSLINIKWFPASIYDVKLPDNYFDIIFANAVLHHLDLLKTKKIILKTLKAGGLCVAADPLRGNWIKNMFYYLVQAIRKSAKGDMVISLKDYQKFAEEFKECQIETWGLFSMINNLLCHNWRLEKKLVKLAWRLDNLLFDKFPKLKQFGGEGVMILRAPSETVENRP